MYIPFHLTDKLLQANDVQCALLVVCYAVWEPLPKQECCRCDVQPNCDTFSSCGTTPSPPQKEMRLLCTLTQKVIYVKKLLECEYAQKHSMSPTIYDIPGLIIAIMI